LSQLLYKRKYTEEVEKKKKKLTLWLPLPANLTKAALYSQTSLKS